MNHKQSSESASPLNQTSSSARLIGAAGTTRSVHEHPKRRKGVAAVLAMMFLIIFGSLTAAMAVASRGNITTAATHEHVLRAQSAAETGLTIAAQRLENAANRFRLSESDMTSTVSWDIWRGSLGGYNAPVVIADVNGRQDLAAPAGIVQALAEIHAMDQNVIAALAPANPTIGNVSAAVITPADYVPTSWLYTPAIALEAASLDPADPPPLAYQITYAPLANGTDIRVICAGYDFSYSNDRRGRAAEPVRRIVMQDFRLSKRVTTALISPSRVMLGKNVNVIGDMGLRYNDVTFNNGDPLILRSDFKGLAATLDNKLNAFYASLGALDVDGDNRLRVGHPSESTALTNATSAYQTSSGTGDTPYTDVTGDGYVDEYDIFLKQYDANTDGRVSRPEFTGGSGQLIDGDLFDMIDSSAPDRNRNGVFGFIDADNDGKYDSGELFVDVDMHDNPLDNDLGYLDGYLDRRDRFTKIKGSLMFKTSAGAWQAARGALRDKLQGAISPTQGDAAQRYSVNDNGLPDVNAAMFEGSRSDLATAADGGNLTAQSAAPLAVPSTVPTISPVLPDIDLDGLPDNYATAYFEKMPYNSPNFSDFYYRPVYNNMVFRDMEIPAGTNALFNNCWFIGVTWIRSSTVNTHSLWNEYGKMNLPAASTTPRPVATRSIYGDSPTETSYPAMLPASATPPMQMILMAATPMDKADIPQDQVAFVTGFNNLPDPLIIAGKRVTDTKAHSNNLRFHNCLFVGSIVSDVPQNYTQIRNKLQFTGATRFYKQHPTSTNVAYNPETADKSFIEKSSMMVPNYSVDVGSFNSPATQDVKMSGAIIAGIIDIRGNTEIDGALILTFKPEHGVYPLRDVLGNPIGNPANFNATIGYFGASDGDSESMDPNTLPLVGGVRIVGWDTNGDGLADVNADSPQPGGSTPIAFQGYGKVQLRFDPKMKLPNGIRMPLQFDRISSTYREGRP